MQIGLNQNVKHEGKWFHVQTEDVPARESVVTQVFVDGQIVHTYAFPYAEWKSDANWEDRVHEQAKKQHSIMVMAVNRGRLNEKK